MFQWFALSLALAAPPPQCLEAYLELMELRSHPRGLLEKPDIDTALYTLDLSPRLRKRFLSFTGRTEGDGAPIGGVSSHVYRLLQRDGVERDLGEAVLYHYEDYLDSLEFSQKSLLKENMGAENLNNPVLWSLAPYLLEGLTRRGESTREAMVRIMKWAGAVTPDRDDEVVTLLGMGMLNEQRVETFILDESTQHPSHRFARLMARELLESLEVFRP